MENSRTSPNPGLGQRTESVIPPTLPNKNTYKSEYQKRFLPFFVVDNVKLAPITIFERDEQASEALQVVIDSYLQGKQTFEFQGGFNASALFNMRSPSQMARGRNIMPVRDIISQVLGNARQPIDLTTESQMAQAKHTRQLLKTVPYKILSFAEDVRPPYKGTYTAKPITSMRKLARNPLRRDLPRVNYDYDSEAEWDVDDNGDGEDIESDGEEDEDLGDGAEDLEEFLDDADDEIAKARKLVTQGDLEPECSGLCWENENRRGPDVKMHRFEMEIISGTCCNSFLEIYY